MASPLYTALHPLYTCFTPASHSHVTRSLRQVPTEALCAEGRLWMASPGHAVEAARMRFRDASMEASARVYSRLTPPLDSRFTAAPR
jgi:hypothetical protein